MLATEHAHRRRSPRQVSAPLASAPARAICPRPPNPHRARPTKQRPSSPRFPPWEAFKRRPHNSHDRSPSGRRPKPFTKGDLQNRPNERAESARKRSLAEGVGRAGATFRRRAVGAFARPFSQTVCSDHGERSGFRRPWSQCVQMTNEFDPPILATEFAIGDDTQADPLWGRSHPGSLRRRPHVDRRRRPLHSARADALRRCCRGEAGCRQCRRAVRLLCHQRSIPFRRTPHGRRASLGTRAVSNLGRADDRLAVFEERLRHVERPEAVKAGDRDQHRKGQRREIDRALEAGRY